MKIYAIWGYPEVIFMEINSTFSLAPPLTRWKPPHFKTSNDWSPPQTPSNSYTLSPFIVSKLKVRSCNVWNQDQKLLQNLRTTHWCVQASFPHKFSLPSQLVFFFHKLASFIILKSMSLFGVAQQMKLKEIKLSRTCIQTAQFRVSHQLFLSPTN